MAKKAPPLPPRSETVYTTLCLLLEEHDRQHLKVVYSVCKSIELDDMEVSRAMLHYVINRLDIQHENSLKRSD